MAEEKFNPRKYMEMAVGVMKKSVHEPRKDKACPFVGAVLIKPDGSVDTAFRGEYRYGDHAEFTLLDRKKRNEILDGSILFATLEPCAPKSRNLPKLSCSERIVNARIKKVWIGIEDPDPTVDRKGIKHLLDHNIEVEMFDRDLQKEIREAIINAIVHRDYDIEGAPIYFEINDNAIIIKSPGAPVLPLKLEQIKQFNAPSLSRNPKIMYVFDQLKLVEQRGLGFQTLKELPDKFNLPLPLVSFENPYMVFKFPRSAKAIKSIAPESRLSKLNEEELAGYNYIRVIGKTTRKEYEDHFSFDKKKAERHLKHLVELGLIARKGSGPSGLKSKEIQVIVLYAAIIHPLKKMFLKFY